MPHGGSGNIMSSSLPSSSFMKMAASNSASNNKTNSSSSSDLTFERKEIKSNRASIINNTNNGDMLITPIASSSSQSQNSSPSSMTRKKRVFTIEGATFWKILLANKQYLHSCMEAQKTICIPPDEEVEYVFHHLKYPASKLQAFIKDHILSNSPLFVGEFITDRGNHLSENKEKFEILEKEKRKTLNLSSLSLSSIMEEAEKVQPVNILQSGKGFSKHFTVQVLKEETCYNDNFKPYKVLFIDKCLSDEYQQITVGASLQDHHSTKDSSKKDDRSIGGSKQWSSTSPSNMEDYHLFLQDWNFKAYNDKLKRSIQHFNFNYLLLKGFHSAIPDKIREYFDVIYGEFVSSQQPTPEEEKDLKNSIHCVLMEGIYDKLFPFLEKYAFNEEDKNFLTMCEVIDAACSKSENNEPAEFDLYEILNISKSFQCNQTDSITYFSKHLNCARNPFDKMKCLKQTTDKIVACINRQQSNMKTEFVTTDDMIPLLAYVVVKCKIPNLITNFNFMQDYQLEEEHGLSEYGFSVTTLNATIMFLKTEIYANNEHKWKKYKKKVTNTDSKVVTPTKSQKPFKLDVEPYLSPISPVSGTTSPSLEQVDRSPSTTLQTVNKSTTLEEVTKTPSTPQDDQPPLVESHNNLSGLLSPRDSRSLALKQKRQEEREKRMSLRKQESIAVIKSFENKVPEKKSSSSSSSSGTLPRQMSLPQFSKNSYDKL
ncbi:hypothetical protein C9374_008978 [Naegleria lovaniensis]|uniref:VPS9 domain-containing protein n=1 Tax=Naegleria lovaniensis TaxID=51637 RepID=A0AA88KHJ4_NAELO|nr:uncharacterized protein C9374_008978 [Naegleria lovaniensis]KAG2377893.1 hypothetical protein C9374_008978 [Naegleria lovaniensis]